MLDAPLSGRVLFEEVIREKLDLLRATYPASSKSRCG
jgi:hypothetical protein